MNKKIILIFLAQFALLTMHAEDVLQVVPFEAQRGATSADGCSFSINMNNASADIWAFQFEILLPEGMTLDDTGGLNPFEFGDRCPHTIGRGGVKNFKHIVNYRLQDDGWWRVVVITTEADRIEGYSGEVLRAYYLTDENMSEGIHPIYVRGTVLTIDGNSDIKPADASSYCVVGASPFATEKSPASDMLTGYIPSWVVDNIADELSANDVFAELSLCGADELGCELVLPNKNALCYVKSGTSASMQISGANVVECDGEYTCDALSLYDGQGDFYASKSVNCASASFDRMFKGGLFSTVCLPFAVSPEKVAELESAGVIIEELSSFDEANATICFSKANSMQPNRPYLIKCPTDMRPFESVSVAKIESSATMNDVSAGAVTMRGTFSKMNLNSTAARNYYVYDAADGSFVLVGNNGTVPPMRAYIEIPASARNEVSFRVQHGNGTTSIADIAADSPTNVSGRYLLDGRRSDVTPTKGIYIINGKKVLIR